MGNEIGSTTKYSEYPCWMWSHCPYKNAACRCTQPEDEGCYVYRRFRDIFREQGLLKESTHE